MKKLFDKVGKKREKEGTLVGKVVMVGQYSVRVEAIVGEGGFATIYRCIDVKSGHQFALKHMRLGADNDAIREVQQEAKTMARLKGHPNILKLHAVAFAGPQGAETDGFMLLDFCPLTLLEVMQRSNFILDDYLVYEIFQDVVWAVAHMHKCNPPLAHRDLKAENVLKNSEGRWVICDFGSSTSRAQVYGTAAEIAVEEENIRRTTTPAYRAPEMWDLYTRQRIDTAVDVWALGVLLYVLAFGKLPFQGDAKLSILYGKYDMPAGRPAAMRSLIQDMLQVNPADRPDIFQVISKLDVLRNVLSSDPGEPASGAPRPSRALPGPGPGPGPGPAPALAPGQHLPAGAAAAAAVNPPSGQGPLGGAVPTRYSLPPGAAPPPPNAYPSAPQQPQGPAPPPAYAGPPQQPLQQPPRPGLGPLEVPAPVALPAGAPAASPRGQPARPASPTQQPRPQPSTNGQNPAGGPAAPWTRPAGQPPPPQQHLYSSQYPPLAPQQHPQAPGPQPHQLHPYPYPYPAPQPGPQPAQQGPSAQQPAQPGPPPQPHAYPSVPGQGGGPPQAPPPPPPPAHLAAGPRPAPGQPGQPPVQRLPSRGQNSFSPNWPAAPPQQSPQPPQSPYQPGAPAPAPQVPNLMDESFTSSIAPPLGAGHAASAAGEDQDTWPAPAAAAADGAPRGPGPEGAASAAAGTAHGSVPGQQQHMLQGWAAESSSESAQGVTASAGAGHAAAMGFGDDNVDWGEQPAFGGGPGATAAAAPGVGGSIAAGERLQPAQPPTQHRQQPQQQLERAELINVDSPRAARASSLGRDDKDSASAGANSTNAATLTGQAASAPGVAAGSAHVPAGGALQGAPLPAASSSGAQGDAARGTVDTALVVAAGWDAAAGGGTGTWTGHGGISSDTSSEVEALRSQLQQLCARNAHLEGRVLQLEGLVSSQGAMLQRLAADMCTVMQSQQQQQQSQQQQPQVAGALSIQPGDVAAPPMLLLSSGSGTGSGCGGDGGLRALGAAGALQEPTAAAAAVAMSSVGDAPGFSLSGAMPSGGPASSILDTQSQAGVAVPYDETWQSGKLGERPPSGSGAIYPALRYEDLG